MTQPKFQVGDIVNFTYLINPDGSYSAAWERWDDLRSHIGSGIIRFVGNYTYGVEIIDPPNYKGEDFGGLLKSAKGLIFHREALRFEQPAQMSLVLTKTKSKPERDERAFFKKDKPTSDPCPKCGSPTTQPIRTIYCTKCEWKMEP